MCNWCFTNTDKDGGFAAAGERRGLHRARPCACRGDGGFGKIEKLPEHHPARRGSIHPEAAAWAAAAFAAFSAFAAFAAAKAGHRKLVRKVVSRLGARTG